MIVLGLPKEVPHTEGFKTRDIYSPPHSQARRQESRCGQGGPPPPKALGADLSLSLPVAAVARVLALPWLVGATPPATTGPLPPASARATAASYKDTSCLGLGSILLQHNSS